MKKRFSAAVLVVGLILSFSAGVAASDTLQEINAVLRSDATIQVNGVEKQYQTQGGRRLYPIEYDGMVYLPTGVWQLISGKTIAWNAQTATISVVDPTPAPAPPKSPATPPAGGAKATPPSGASSGSPAGASSAPPAGSSSAPPAGGSSAPPAGGSSAPPAGGSSAPASSTPPASGSNLTLSSGHYVAGKDFPAGTYDVVAVSGGGFVSSNNPLSGGINAILGDETMRAQSSMYEAEYKNVKLPKDTELTVSQVTIKLIKK